MSNYPEHISEVKIESKIVHIKLENKTLCGIDITKNPSEWVATSREVNCQICKNNNHNLK